MEWLDYIQRVPGVMLGKPLFKGTRIPVEFVQERPACGRGSDNLVVNHAPSTAEHIKAALARAAAEK